MSTEILDDFRPTPKSYYAKNAYRLFWITTAFFVIPICLTITFPPSKKNEVFYFLLGLGMFISIFTSLAGLGYGIRSFIKKESSNKKYIGTLGNLFFAGIFGLTLLMNLKDLSRWFTT